MKETSEINLIILAGGASKRMAFPKAKLLLKSGWTFLENLLEQYYNAGIRLFTVVLNPCLEDLNFNELRAKFPQADLQFILNSNEGSTRLDSIKIGLNEIKACDAVFLQDVDRPLINVETIRALALNLYEEGVVQPVFEGKGGHPVLLGRQVIAEIGKQNGFKTLKEALSTYPHKRVEVNDPGIMINVNDREAYHLHIGLDLEVHQ